MSEYRELLIGCGHARKKNVWKPDYEEWHERYCMDIDESCQDESDKGFYVWDLEHLPYPFEDNWLDEIHAYEVLEHLGQQGDYKSFFALFTELHRILKPGGIICASVPVWDGSWAWGDPGHRRVINAGTLSFLSQKMYEEYIGKNAMTDYRRVYKADLEVLHTEEKGGFFLFVLEAIK